MTVKTKSSLKGTETRKMLINWEMYQANGSQGFYFCDGRYVAGITELKSTLQNISDDIFNHHVTSDRNDFANWVKDVFGLSTLSDKIRKARSRKSLISVLEREIG